MDPTELVIVTGLGRCGSTLAMGMLEAAGFPVVCESRLSFEHSKAAEDPIDPAWLRSCAGKAVKILDPLRHRLPGVAEGFRLRFIFLTRNPNEQAKSAAKMIRLFRRAVLVRGAVRRLRESIERDVRPTRDYLIDRGVDCLALEFEEILAAPNYAAARLVDWLEPCGSRGLRADRAAGVVRARSPRCLPGLAELDSAEALRQRAGLGPGA